MKQNWQLYGWGFFLLSNYILRGMKIVCSSEIILWISSFVRGTLVYKLRIFLKYMYLHLFIYFSVGTYGQGSKTAFISRLVSGEEGNGLRLPQIS